MVSAQIDQTNDTELWEKAENAFRLMAFHEYYRKSELKDNSLRFAQAIIDSARPITDQRKRQAIIQWYKDKNKMADVQDTTEGGP